MDVEIYTFPDKIFPTCNSELNTLQLNVGETLKLSCTSQKGYPVVELKWSCINFDIPFKTHHNSQNGDMEMSEITVTVDVSQNGAVFVCKMTSKGFPDKVRSCTVGPLNIAQSTSNIDAKKPIQNNVNVVKSNTNIDHDTAKKCEMECPLEDRYILLYWAVACVGTTILMFIFLTTTIIYCCKYQTIAGDVVTAHGSFTSCDGSEPVYVSLQRRQLPERDSMFMSVEDPNNPGNKLLMPREVFDELYRSLSLNKRDPGNQNC